MRTIFWDLPTKKTVEQFAQPFIFLIIKIVVADGESVVAVFGDPGGCGQGCVEEEEGAARHVGALKADLRRQGGGVSRGVVDRAVKNGAELHSVLAIEDHAVNSVRIVFRLHAVHYHVTRGDLADEGLATALGVDNSAKPEDLILVVKFVGVKDRLKAAREANAAAIDSDGHTHRLGKGAYGHVKPAVAHNYAGGSVKQSSAVSVCNVATVIYADLKARGGHS